MHCRRIGWTTVRPPKDSNLFSLYQKRRHSGACKLDMPVEAFKGGLIGVTLAGNMGEATAFVARIACQAIDKALKRHIERGGYSDTPEMLTGLHIDPMCDIRDGRP